MHGIGNECFLSPKQQGEKAISKEKAESKTACESTVNDAYLIVSNDNKLMKKSYRKNLIGVLLEMDERGYLIYQLTRL